jgi:transposase
LPDVAPQAQADAKKKDLHASERDRPDNEAKRQAFFEEIAETPRKNLYFFDEAGSNTSMTRTYARAPKGERAYGSAPKNWGGNVTIAALICLAGLCAPVVIRGAMSGDHFVSYLAQFVAPTLPDGSVVVVDNLSAHKRVEGRQVLLARGIRLVFLPPYSPDLNPIERCWSKVKEALRAAEARSVEALEEAIAVALRAVTQDDILGWFQWAGYVPD